MATRDLVGLVYNSLVPEANDLVRSLVESQGLQKKSWVRSAAEVEQGKEGLAEELTRTSVVITAGGDGTILRAVGAAAPYAVPILGINLGRVGFMTELEAHEAKDRVGDYLNGDHRVEERMMLQASVAAGAGQEPSLTMHGLNDAVVGSTSVARLVDIAVTVDDAALTTYRADGMIVSTATGSTGYALSAGGPIVHPEARLLLLQPVASHMSLQSALILSETSVLRLESAGQVPAALSVDGSHETTLGPEAWVTVRRSPHVARFLRARPPSGFYKTLTRRLNLHERQDQA